MLTACSCLSERVLFESRWCCTSRVITRCVWFTPTWQWCAQTPLLHLLRPLLIPTSLFSACVKVALQLLNALSKIEIWFPYSQVPHAHGWPFAFVWASERTVLFFHSGWDFKDWVCRLNPHALSDSHVAQCWYRIDFCSQFFIQKSFWKPYFKLQFVPVHTQLCLLTSCTYIDRSLEREFAQYFLA